MLRIETMNKFMYFYMVILNANFSWLHQKQDHSFKQVLSYQQNTTFYLRNTSLKSFRASCTNKQLMSLLICLSLLWASCFFIYTVVHSFLMLLILRNLFNSHWHYLSSRAMICDGRLNKIADIFLFFRFCKNSFQDVNFFIVIAWLIISFSHRTKAC